MSFFKGLSNISILLASFFGQSVVHADQTTNTSTAIFAMGCFWCAQSDFDKIPGVVKTVVGYTGGSKSNANYKQVSNGGTGHYEVLQVTYNPTKISYGKILDVFWKNVDPVDPSGQFCDKGEQYKAVIFYNNEKEKDIAEKSKMNLMKSHKFNITTKILPAKTFYPAEDYHQDYYKKNPVRYNFYRFNCGRDKRLKEIWQK